ncbi:MAG: recombinase family protein [Actinomycetota bacterium]|nr:recombinase family protein [Actinomycetota bacterium]
MTKETMRPAVYVRVSTEEQAQTGTSLRTQIDSLKGDLKSEKAVVPLLFIDDGYSGATPHRPGLMELETAIAEGKVSEVRITALDRLSRDLVLQETLLSRWAKQGVTFISQREPDLGLNDPTRVLIRQVLGAISQYERSVIAGRMLAGRIARARQGYWPGGKAPFGLVLDGEPPRAVIDPDKAEVIREAGLRILKGERAAWVAEDLNRRNVEGPGGKGWESGYLSRMLRNSAYKGEARYRVREFMEPKTRRKSEHAVRGTKNTAQIRPEAEWVTFEVPAIFTDAEWEAIQTELGKRGMPKREAEAYLLSRRFESACGASYHGNRGNGNARYLCSRRINRKKTGDEDCGCSQVPAEQIDSAVWRGIAEVLFEPERLSAIALEELRRRGIADSEDKMQARLRSLDRAIVKKRESLTRLISFHAENETLIEEDFVRAAGSMRRRIEQLEQERANVLRFLPGAQASEDQRAIEAIASEVRERLQTLSFEEKQRVLALLDVRVNVDEYGHLKGSLSAPQVDQRKVAKNTSSR